MVRGGRAGSVARQVTYGLETFDWSPDRSRLAYTTFRGGCVAMILADAADLHEADAHRCNQTSAR